MEATEEEKRPNLQFVLVNQSFVVSHKLIRRSTLCGDNERACLHRAIPDRLQDHVPFIVPRAECLE
jgi:hypothetical protein